MITEPMEAPDLLEKRITSQSPIHMVLLADDSSSMRGERAAAATEALHTWVNELCVAARGKMPYFRISVIVFGSGAQILSDETNEFRAENLDVLDIDISGFVLNGSSGTTNLTAALELAQDVLARDGSTAESCPPFVFVFTDGSPTDAKGYATDEAAAAALVAAENLKLSPLPCGAPYVITLGFGKAKDAFMTRLASREGLYLALPNAQALIQLLPAIGTPTVGGKGTIGTFLAGIENAGGNVKDR